MPYSLKVEFSNSSINSAEMGKRIKHQLLSHTNGSEELLKDIFDEASRHPDADSTWSKIESISRFNALLAVLNPKDIHLQDIRYSWVKYEEKRGLSK